jgi:hypothetical protein
MDWPLSRDEKKEQIIRLYNDDVCAADCMLSSGEAALEALRDELETVRLAAGIRTVAAKKPGNKSNHSDAEVERLRGAVETAAAVLRAILPSQSDPDEGISEAVSGKQQRARSEGGTRETGTKAIRPSLRPKKVSSRPGTPRKRVSFGHQPEEEPIHFDGSKKVGSGDDKTKDCAQLPTVGSDNSQPGAMRGATCKWLGLGLVGSLGLLAMKLGSDGVSSSMTAPVAPAITVPVAPGDPECWKGPYNFDLCCNGPIEGGHPGCWDINHNFRRCCLGQEL